MQTVTALGQKRFESSFEDRSQGEDAPSFLTKDFKEVWSANGDVPLLNFVSSNIESGGQFIFGEHEPAFYESLSDWFGRYRPVEEGSVRVVTAAGISARFPWVTSSAALGGSSVVTNVARTDTVRRGLVRLSRPCPGA